MPDKPRYYVKLALDGFDGKSEDMWALTPVQRYVWFSYIAFARRFQPHGFLSTGVDGRRPIPATLDRLAEWAGVARRTIIRTNERLIELGMLRKDRRRNTVCLEVVNWSKWQANDSARESLPDDDSARESLPPKCQRVTLRVPESHSQSARESLLSPPSDSARESLPTPGSPEPQDETASQIPDEAVPLSPALESPRSTSRRTSRTTPSPQQPALDIEGLPVPEEQPTKAPHEDTEVQAFIKDTFARLDLGDFPVGKKNLKGYSSLTQAIAKKGLPVARKRVEVMLSQHPQLPAEAQHWAWFVDQFVAVVMRPWEYGIQTNETGSRAAGGKGPIPPSDFSHIERNPDGTVKV